jgi:hypothetical protein
MVRRKSSPEGKMIIIKTEESGNPDQPGHVVRFSNFGEPARHLPVRESMNIATSNLTTHPQVQQQPMQQQTQQQQQTRDVFTQPRQQEQGPLYPVLQCIWG